MNISGASSMSYNIIFTKSYTKRAARFIKKHPDLTGQYEKTLKLLRLNPNHPSLELHSLKGKLTGLHSASVNISYRITIEILIRSKTIIPVYIGTHDEVYR
jgi:mRNA-degrading endonuclease YafQ of YafQ-DinJ toxin-antitoxin module